MARHLFQIPAVVHFDLGVSWGGQGGRQEMLASREIKSKRASQDGSSRPEEGVIVGEMGVRENQRLDQQASSAGSQGNAHHDAGKFYPGPADAGLRQGNQVVEKCEQDNNRAILCTTVVPDAFATSRRQGSPTVVPNFDARMPSMDLISIASLGQYKPLIKVRKHVKVVNNR
ncbi:hypothetical protein PABG_12291 [Paracoccidioides brasiliensis Pb03]|nr:hypothetical protein PABG_12291 [Paracoccidioides brasiliensis Pb03]